MDKKFGVLCHVSSLVSDYGIGDVGSSARKFIKFLSNNKIDVWQILPLNVTNEYNCPYGSNYAFSIDPMYVCPEDLLKRKLIKPKHLKTLKSLKDTYKVDYETVKREKNELINIAFKKVKKQLKEEVETFVKMYPDIREYAIFNVMLKNLGIYDWRNIPKQLLDVTSIEYADFVLSNSYEIEKQEFVQYILFVQWQETLMFAKTNSVKILGDMPIYPNRDSFDVFKHSNVFKLDKNLYPVVTGGAPPDEFCSKGQNWGSCVYDWKKLERNGFEYFINKIKRMLNMYDILRLDHFAGYVEHYEVNNENHKLNAWVKGGGEKFFNKLKQHVEFDDIVVEDLGALTQECKLVKNQFNLTGMHVLQFDVFNKRFSLSKIEENSICYLGTHDNNTFIGFLNGLTTEQKQKVCKVLEIEYASNEEILINATKQLINGNAEYVVLQMQDMLLQSETEKMNIPGQAAGCWDYRVPKNYKKQFNKTCKKLFG